MKILVSVVVGISALFMTHADAAQEIVVSTINRPPFVFIEDAKGEVTYRGFTIDLMEEIADRTDFDITYVPQTQFSEMLTSVSDGTVDVAAANISVTAQRESTMDFTQPIYDGGLQILMRKGDSVPLWKLFWESGILKFLGFAVGVLLVIAHMLWLFERGVKDRRHDYFRDDYFGGIWDSFWWAFIIMTMGGFENEVPHKKLSRILAMFWIVVSLFFISTLTAKITTALTVDTLTSSVDSYKDLYDKKIGIAAGTTMEHFAQKEGLPYVKYDDFTLSLKALKAGETDAVIGDAPIVQYYAAHDGAGTMTLAGDIFAPDKIAIALAQDSKYYEQINRALLTIKEDGTYAEIYKKWFGE